MTTDIERRLIEIEQEIEELRDEKKQLEHELKAVKAGRKQHKQLCIEFPD
jgi:predicted  nucleic acid-binding Zn-ribbon protein